jgi:hypothetical protein
MQGRIGPVLRMRWKVLERVEVLLAIVVAVVTLIVGIRSCVPARKPEDIRLVDSESSMFLSPQNMPTGSVFVADRVAIDGVVTLPAGALIAGNEVSFANGAKISSRDVTIIATRVEGGQIDASGVTPAGPGAQGQSGGTVFIAAAVIRGTSIVADGSDGRRGSDGEPGTNGRDGECDGFGGYRGANPGGQGGHGGRGGDGGSGGRIVVFVNSVSRPDTSVSPGKSGAGGAGGPGGRGGAGCIGLGGSQPTQQNGIPGASGDEGSRGQPGQSDIRTGVPFEAVAEKFRGARSELPSSLNALRQQIESLR